MHHNTWRLCKGHRFTWSVIHKAMVAGNINLIGPKHILWSSTSLACVSWPKQFSSYYGAPWVVCAIWTVGSIGLYSEVLVIGNLRLVTKLSSAIVTWNSRQARVLLITLMKVQLFLGPEVSLMWLVTSVLTYYFKSKWILWKQTVILNSLTVTWIL